MTAGDPLLAELRRAPKYADLSDEVLAAALAWARPRERRDADVIKRAKRKLHQVYGAFLGSGDRKRLLAALDRAASSEDEGEWLDLLRGAMALHASTRERLGEVEGLWAEIVRRAGRPGSVVDLGCGLGPLMLPFSGLDRGTRWIGVDVDARVCAGVQGALIGRCPGVRVRSGDARSPMAGERFDLALLLKLVPTLDQLQAGAGAEVIARVPAEVVVVSFPRRTLGGRAVGMDQAADATAARALAGWIPLGRIALASEIAWLARRPATTG